jgi:uncharacterized protein (DUF2141 family)
MKGHTVALALAGALLATPALADDGCSGVHAAGTAKLVVHVTGVRSAQGEVAITLYPDNRRKFLAKTGKLVRVRLPAAASVTTCFWLPPANYAVATYHDADGDRDFDRTIMGMPAEGFGFSNNPETKIGLPPLSQVRFRLPPGEGSVTIQMRYLR